MNYIGYSCLIGIGEVAQVAISGIIVYSRSRDEDLGFAIINETNKQSNDGDTDIENTNIVYPNASKSVS